MFFSDFLKIRGLNLCRCGSKGDWNRTLSHAVPHDWFWRPYYDVIAQISKFRRSMAYDMSTEMPWSTELISGSRVPYKLGGHHLWFWWRHYDVIMKFSHFHRNIACNMSKKGIWIVHTVFAWIEAKLGKWLTMNAWWWRHMGYIVNTYWL